MNADTYLRKYANRPEYFAPKTYPPAPTKSGLAEVADKASDSINHVSDWVDFDSLASIIAPDEKELLTALNCLDGATSAHQAIKEANSAGHKANSLKTGLRVGLSLAGALPGLTGSICEGLAGAWTFHDGVKEPQENKAVMGLTQLAASAGVGLIAASVAGPTGTALVLAANATRAGYRYYRESADRTRQNQ